MHRGLTAFGRHVLCGNWVGRNSTVYQATLSRCHVGGAGAGPVNSALGGRHGNITVHVRSQVKRSAIKTCRNTIPGGGCKRDRHHPVGSGSGEGGAVCSRRSTTCCRVEYAVVEDVLGRLLSRRRGIDGRGCEGQACRAIRLEGFAQRALGRRASNDRLGHLGTHGVVLSRQAGPQPPECR